MVLITSKRGTEGVTKIEYSTYYGIQNIANKLEMLNAYQFATLHNEKSENRGQPLQFTGQMIGDEYYGTPEEYKNATLPSTDWIDEILRAGTIVNHQLSLSGGAEDVRYAISLNRFNNQGIITGGSFSRTSLRINLDTKVNNWLEIGNNLTYSYNVSNNAGSESGLQWFNAGTISAALKAWPVFGPYDEDGNYNITGTGTLRGNPVAYANESINKLTNNRLIDNFFGIITLTEDLSLKISAGVDLITNNRDRYFPTSTYTGSLFNGSAAKVYNRSLNWLNENVLSYTKSFGIHRIDAIAGFTMQQEISEGHGMSAQDFPSDIFENNNMGAGAVQDIPGWSYKSKWSMASWLGRINYNLMDKYLFTLTGRADGSSKFGVDNKWAFFHSFAVGWKLSQEDFIRNLGVFSNRKVRFSYGRRGKSE